jgi:hypothetical protein
MEGIGQDLTEVPTQNFPGGTEVNHKNLSQDSRYPDPDSNQAPSEWKVRARLLAQPTRYTPCQQALYLTRSEVLMPPSKTKWPV